MIGFLFIRRGVAFMWAHPAELQAGDVDCTRMTDDEFEREVLAALGPANVRAKRADTALPKTE